MKTLLQKVICQFGLTSASSNWQIAADVLEENEQNVCAAAMRAGIWEVSILDPSSHGADHNGSGYGDGYGDGRGYGYGDGCGRGGRGNGGGDGSDGSGK